MKFSGADIYPDNNLTLSKIEIKLNERRKTKFVVDKFGTKEMTQKYVKKFDGNFSYSVETDGNIDAQ